MRRTGLVDAAALDALGNAVDQVLIDYSSEPAPPSDIPDLPDSEDQS